MSAQDAIGHIPGAEGIARSANKVLAADVDGIVKLKNGMQRAHDEAVATHEDLASALGALPRHWQGADHDAFQGYMARFTTVDREAHALLRKGIQGLDDAVRKLDDATSRIRRDLNAMAEDYDTRLAAARKRTDEHGDPVPVDTAALGRQVIAAHEPAIDADVREYDQAMAEVARDLDAALSSSGGGFGSIPAPATTSVAPQSAPVHYDSGNAGGHSGGGGGGGPHGFAAGVVAPDVHVSGDVAEWIAEARKILAAHGIHLSDADLKALKLIIQHESGGNPNAVNEWDCVPLDTEILTRRGWRKHDEIEVGDETIGYNHVSERNEWTKITRVVRHRDAPLVQISNTRWSATVTPNHRWLSKPRVSLSKPLVVEDGSGCPKCGWPEGMRRRGRTTTGGLRIHLAKAHGVRSVRQQHVNSVRAEFVTTREVDTRDRLLISAFADTDSRIDITEQESAILGWVAGDGCVENRRHAPSISIAQSKPHLVAKLHRQLEGIPHSVYVDDRGGCGPRHQFRLAPAYAQDLLRRAGNPKKDSVEQVLAMSPAQRASWLTAMIDAEANAQGVIYQSPGPVMEAATLATYLSGRRPRLGAVDRKNAPVSWAPEWRLSGNNPVVTGGFLAKEPVGRGDVWCVSTELGTWTAREQNHVFLTGNSNAAAGHPSQGLMQCIPSTFHEYALPGYDSNIKDPVSNIIAGIRYSISRYGSLTDVPGVRGVAGGSGYVGY